MQTEAHRSTRIVPIRGAVQVYLDSLAPTTRAAVRSKLDNIARLLGGSDATTYPWHELTYRETTLVRSLLSERYPWQTVNNYLSTLKGLLRQAYLLGLMTSESYHRAVSLKGIKGTALLAGRLVHPDEFTKLFAHLAQDRSVLGIRDLAMLATLRATGMRRAELLGLQLADYDPIDVVFKVRGKGNKEREAGAANWLAPLMDDWLERRGRAEGALFTRVYVGGHVDRQLRPLSNVSLHRTLAEQIEAAGVTPFRLHDFRRTLVSELLEAGVDLVAVRDQVGHVNVATTARYDRRGVGKVRKAAQLVQNPLQNS